MRHSFYAAIFMSCVVSAPTFAQQPTVEGSFDTDACTLEQLDIGKCLTLKNTRWRIVEHPGTALELTFEVELRPDKSVLSTHPEASWPQNDSWHVEAGNTLVLRFNKKSYAFRVQKDDQDVLSGEAFEVSGSAGIDPDKKPKTHAFRAATPEKISKNETKILAIYERLVSALHPMATSSIKKKRAVLERVEALTAELKQTDCSTIAEKLQHFTKDSAPGLAAQLKDSQGFEGLDDLTNPLDPSTSTEDQLADAHTTELNKRLVASHKVIYAVVRQCSMQPKVVAGFDALVGAIETP